MRILVASLLCLSVCSGVLAADKLIMLPKSINLNPVPSNSAAKTADAASAAGASASASAQAAAEAPNPAHANATDKVADEVKFSATTESAAMSKEEKAQKELADRIAASLSAIRKKREPAVTESARSSSRSQRSRSASSAKKEDEPVKHSNHWSYEGAHGPEHWGALNPAWAACASGKRQSPIDIYGGIRVDLEQIKFDYKPVNFNVVNNGHTVQVNLGAGNQITVMGRTFDLLQFHFHRPSEERVDGVTYQMVLHLVHKSADGQLAVVAVLVDQGTGNELVQTVWNNLPLEKNEPVMVMSPIDVNQALPVQREYYTYMGSLTTPPCSERVLWMVLKEPIKLSAQQIKIFAHLYPMNARPVQPNSDRLIKQSR